MRLLIFTKFGPVPMVVDDDISTEELGRLIQIALTTEQGNGKIKKEVNNYDGFSNTAGIFGVSR